jgi:hypothetical protein
MSVACVKAKRQSTEGLHGTKANTVYGSKSYAPRVTIERLHVNTQPYKL